MYIQGAQPQGAEEEGTLREAGINKRLSDFVQVNKLSIFDYSPPPPFFLKYIFMCSCINNIRYMLTYQMLIAFLDKISKLLFDQRIQSMKSKIINLLKILMNFYWFVLNKFLLVGSRQSVHQQGAAR